MYRKVCRLGGKWIVFGLDDDIAEDCLSSHCLHIIFHLAPKSFGELLDPWAISRAEASYQECYTVVNHQVRHMLRRSTVGSVSWTCLAIWFSILRYTSRILSVLMEHNQRSNEYDQQSMIKGIRSAEHDLETLTVLNTLGCKH